MTESRAYPVRLDREEVAMLDQLSKLIGISRHAIMREAMLHGIVVLIEKNMRKE